MATTYRQATTNNKQAQATHRSKECSDKKTMNKRMWRAKNMAAKESPKSTTKITKLPEFPTKFPQQPEIAKLTQ
ncbi:hypothetical protein COLO4_22306 [Corchorus olitorius]|uniref:Uncharacterized protein n=1 Tax=Corchorus olitorius TaxID=93759 RepID=A0A1R3IMZ2_9ROSI|nr:hypothetical protein COLO4_22306 [Corchorus olitorius]